MTSRETDVPSGEGRRYRYEVTSVYGVPPKGIAVGVVIVESQYKGIHGSWDVVNLETGKSTGGWNGRYLPPSSRHPTGERP